jgi:hypothetical protein
MKSSSSTNSLKNNSCSVSASHHFLVNKKLGELFYLGLFGRCIIRFHETYDTVYANVLAILVGLFE